MVAGGGDMVLLRMGYELGELFNLCYIILFASTVNIPYVIKLSI
jgi:hypothetical protein